MKQTATEYKISGDALVIKFGARKIKRQDIRRTRH